MVTDVWTVLFACGALYLALPGIRRLGPPLRAFLESASDFAGEYNSMYVD